MGDMNWETFRINSVASVVEFFSESYKRKCYLEMCMQINVRIFSFSPTMLYKMSAQKLVSTYHFHGQIYQKRTSWRPPLLEFLIAPMTCTFKLRKEENQPSSILWHQYGSNFQWIWPFHPLNTLKKREIPCLSSDLPWVNH